MSNVVSGSGTLVYVSSSLPATHDQAGFEALTWTLVNEVTEVGEYGRDYDTIEHAPINTRIIETIKGNYKEGGLPLSFASVPADAGQAVLLTASEADNDISVKIVRTDGQTDYNIGKVFSFKPNIAGGAILSISSQLTFNGTRVSVVV